MIKWGISSYTDKIPAFAGMTAFVKASWIRKLCSGKKGVSTLEIVITLAILAIISGIAITNTQNTIVESEKRHLYREAETFASFVESCIKLSGGWKIFRNGNSYYPCKANNTKDLKKKLNFQCPKGATCETHTHYRSEGPTKRPHYMYHCLSIQKEKSGKKLQVLSNVHFHTPQRNEIWCGEMDNYTPLDQKICRDGGDHNKIGLTKDCPGWH